MLPTYVAQEPSYRHIRRRTVQWRFFQQKIETYVWSCHLARALNIEIGVEFQIFVTVIFFLIAAKFYNLGHIQGIIRVH